MKVTFVSCGAEGLAVQYLSAALKNAQHQTELTFDPTLFNDKVFLNHPKLAQIFNYTNHLIGDVIDSQPDLVAISCVTDTYQWAVQVAKGVKSNLSVPIILGGIHPTLVSDKVISCRYIDMVCIGEGEEALVELANSLEAGKKNTKIANIWFKNHGRLIKNPPRILIQNLDRLPFPDRTIYEPFINTRDSYLAMSSRGCVYNCSYCFNNAMRKIYAHKGNYLRRRTPENFVEELERANRKYDYQILKIYDDIFTYDLNWLEKFTRLYKKKVNKPYFCLSHPKFMSKDAVKLLKQSNCSWVQIGIESLNEQTRKIDCERVESNEEIEKMIKTLDRHHLAYELDHIFGLPHDQEEDYQRAAFFYKNCRSLLKVNTNILSYIPKTQVIKRGIEAQKIRRQDIAKIEAGKEASRVSTGSERNKKQLEMYQGMIVVYKAIKIIPRPVLSLILKHRLYRYLRFFDPWLGYFVRFLSADKIDWLYVKQNIRFLIWRLTK
jgi:radical SAM superfamily enzyme YgiQ (UPF0313 family)